MAFFIPAASPAFCPRYDTMDPQTLQTLSRQLARWAEEAIGSGRFPFRRAETFPLLVTEAGELQPPLVLWINRDSFMAGGLLLFPLQDAEEAIAEGSACARVLGLRHFAAWGAREIVFWKVDERAPMRHRTFPLAAEATPAAFRKIFLALLDEFKILSVTGVISAPELPPAYLANLCRIGRQSSIPPLLESFRIARGEGTLAGAPAPCLAAYQSCLALLRILALLIEDRLPTGIQPEGLDRALQFAVDTLPASLRRALEPAPWEIPLPQESAVRLHHLVHRLAQLRFGQDRSRVLQTLEILFAHDSASLGGHPLPPAEESLHNAWLINPDRLLLEAAAEIAPLPLLAFSALLRHLQGASAPLQATDVFALGDHPRPATILGTLSAAPPLTRPEYRSLSARLRLSWPNRRFPFPPRTPGWAWEMLHLLGLIREGGTLDLITPDDWLTAPWAHPLTEVLIGEFFLEVLERGPNSVRLRVRCEDMGSAATRFDGSEHREIAAEHWRGKPPSFLPLALDLPEALFSLLADGRLHFHDQGCWPEGKEWAIFLFTRSTPGRLLWQTISGGEPLPSRQNLDSLLLKRGFPLPGAEVLNHLQTFSTSAPDPSITVIDQELAPWFGTFAKKSEIPEKKPTGSERLRRGENLAEKISREVFRDGIPRFPDQYLYDHYRPELIEYRFSGALTSGENFFGQITLRDVRGEALVVEGEETARALQLASHTNSDAVALPLDRALTAQLLHRYLADLRQLRQALTREVHRQHTDSRRADILIERIWSSLPLPPWSLVDR